MTSTTVQSAAKHTKGPWVETGLWIANGKVAIANCDMIKTPREQCEANAKLIASAPEMGKTLLSVRDVVKQFAPEEFPMFDIVLKKAGLL